MNWEVLELPFFPSSHLRAFCSLANLLYLFSLLLSLEKHKKDSNFAGYSDRNFTNYGMDQLSGTDSFQKYSSDENIPVNSFRLIQSETRRATRTISSIKPLNGNVVDQSFNSYGTGDYRRLRCVLQVRRRLVSRPTHLSLFSLLFLSLSLSVHSVTKEKTRTMKVPRP
jgi:hypothetical protein